MAPEPAPEIQREPPRLYVIEGYGEEPAGPDDSRPELHAVTDTELPEAAHYDESTPKRLMGVVREAGSRVVRRTARFVATATEAVSYDDDDQARKGGGGGWLIREHMRKIAKEKAEAEAALQHEDDCTGCQVCTS